jgi:hypothetical protein
MMHDNAYSPSRLLPTRHWDVTIELSHQSAPSSCSDRNAPSPEVLSVQFSYCMVPEVYQLFGRDGAR